MLGPGVWEVMCRLLEVECWLDVAYTGDCYTGIWAATVKGVTRNSMCSHQYKPSQASVKSSGLQEALRSFEGVRSWIDRHVSAVAPA